MRGGNPQHSPVSTMAPGLLVWDMRPNSVFVWQAAALTQCFQAQNPIIWGITAKAVQLGQGARCAVPQGEGGCDGLDVLTAWELEVLRQC